MASGAISNVMALAVWGPIIDAMNSRPIPGAHQCAGTERPNQAAIDLSRDLGEILAPSSPFETYRKTGKDGAWAIEKVTGSDVAAAMLLAIA